MHKDAYRNLIIGALKNEIKGALPTLQNGGSSDPTNPWAILNEQNIATPFQTNDQGILDTATGQQYYKTDPNQQTPTQQLGIPGEFVAQTTDTGYLQPYLTGFNFLANSIASSKERADTTKYNDLMGFLNQQPAPVNYNTGYRFGFEKGGQLPKAQLGLLTSAAYGGDRLIPASAPYDPPTSSMAIKDFTSDIVSDAVVSDLGSLPFPVPTPVTQEEVPLNTNYEQTYAQRAQRYLDAEAPGTAITGDMLAKAATAAMNKYGKEVPVEIALAQLTQEGFLAKGKTPNKPQRTNNPFNVGNVDSGAVKKFDKIEEGVQRYYDLLAKSYLKTRTPEELLNNFVNTSGNRYASDKNYEKRLKDLIEKRISKYTYEEGGIYNVDETEYERLKQLGYDIEIIP